MGNIPPMRVEQATTIDRLSDLYFSGYHALNQRHNCCDVVQLRSTAAERANLRSSGERGPCSARSDTDAPIDSWWIASIRNARSKSGAPPRLASDIERIISAYGWGISIPSRPWRARSIRTTSCTSAAIARSPSYPERRRSWTSSRTRCTMRALHGELRHLQAHAVVADHQDDEVTIVDRGLGRRRAGVGWPSVGRVGGHGR